jgi:hypothetical protein
MEMPSIDVEHMVVELVMVVYDSRYRIEVAFVGLCTHTAVAVVLRRKLVEGIVDLNTLVDSTEMVVVSKVEGYPLLENVFSAVVSKPCCLPIMSIMHHTK